MTPCVPTKKTLMSKFILKYGLIGGLLAAAGLLPFSFFDSNAPDYDLGEIVGWTSMIIGNGVIVLAMLAYRKQYPKESFSFAKGMKLGLGIAAIAASIFVVFDTFYVTVINPDFFEQYSAYEVQKMVDANVAQAEIDAAAAEMSAYSGPSGVAILETIMFVSVFLIGLVVTIIASLVFSVLDKSRQGHEENPPLDYQT